MSKEATTGWKHVFKNYDFKAFVKDLKKPFILSVAIVVLVFISEVSVFNTIELVVNNTINVIATILSLLFAAYAITITLFWSDYGKRIRRFVVKDGDKENKVGRQLLENLNADFAVGILALLVTLVYLIVLNVIIGLRVLPFNSTLSELFNLFVLFFTLLCVFYAIVTLVHIVINTYNLANITKYFEKDK